MKTLKNFEIVTIALHSCGGASKFIDTEEVAIQSDKIDPERFKWKKYKTYIDRGLILSNLDAAKKRKKGSFVKGNDNTGWVLTSIGLDFAKSASSNKTFFIKKKRLSKIEKQYLLREENRIKNSQAFNKFFYGNKETITTSDIKNLFKIDDYTSKEDAQKRIHNLIDNFSEHKQIYEIINKLKKKVGGLLWL